MNGEIVRFENEVAAVFNGSSLPLEVKRLVLRDLLGQIEAARASAMQESFAVRKEAGEDEQGA